METELVKVLQLKYPIISYMNKLYEGNKKNIVNSNFTLQNAKIALQNQKKDFNCDRLQTSLHSGNYCEATL